MMAVRFLPSRRDCGSQDPGTPGKTNRNRSLRKDPFSRRQLLCFLQELDDRDPPGGVPVRQSEEPNLPVPLTPDSPPFRR